MSIERKAIASLALVCVGACGGELVPSDDSSTTVADGSSGPSTTFPSTTTTMTTTGPGTTGTTTVGSATVADTGDCPIGSSLCPCTLGGGCDPGLVCADGICLDVGGTTSTETNSSSSDTGQPGELEPWTLRRPIYVDNPNDEDLTDYQVMLDIGWDDGWNADLSDLRFTDESGSEIFPHWIESSVAPVNVRAWVRVASLAANDVTLIYVWFGNADATSVDDPSATFEFFEDFEGNDLDGTVWAASDLYDVANGRLSMQTGAVYTVEAPIAQPGFVVEALLRWPPGDGGGIQQPSGINIADAQGDVPGTTDYLLMSGVPGIGLTAFDGGTPLASYVWPNPFEPTQFTWMGISAADDLIRGQFTHDWADINHTDFAAVLPSHDYYIRLGGNGGAAISNSEIVDVEYDIVLARRYAFDPPTSLIGAAEDV
jgi:hypothetical protein